MGSRIPRDIEEFQRGYPDQGNNPKYRTNLDFYSNAAPMRPDNLTYEEFLNQYERNWNELEQNHAYIQWLFPIPEQGLNYRARPLQKHEQQAMAADPVILARIERSYSTMLAFYGIEFNSGHLRLSVGYEPHLNNLSHHAHNLLRITRILKHISLFPSLQAHAAPLVLFFCALHEEGLLDFSPSRMHGSSLDDFWSGCFRDEAERAMVKAYIKQRSAFPKISTKARGKRENNGPGGMVQDRTAEGEGGEKMVKITLRVADPDKGRNEGPAGGVGEKGGKGDGGKRKWGRDSGGSSDGSSKKTSPLAASSDALAAVDRLSERPEDPSGSATTAAAAPAAPLRGFARWEAWYRQHRSSAQVASTSGTSGDTSLESDGTAERHSSQDEMSEVQHSSQATLVDGLDNLKAEEKAE